MWQSVINLVVGRQLLVVGRSPIVHYFPRSQPAARIDGSGAIFIPSHLQFGGVIPSEAVLQAG
jgi:hypothetical protein